MKKKEMEVINYTQEAYNELPCDHVLATITAERISDGNAISVLTEIVESGALSIKAPNVLMDWTYKGVQVEGVKADDIPGKVEPSVKLTAEEFEQTTAQEMAKYIAEYTTQARAGKILLVLIDQGIYKPTAAHMVKLTNGRITIEGIELPKKNMKKRASVLITGIVVNNEVQVGA